MRTVAVIGLSTFGAGLVRALAEERCRVLAVDIDSDKVEAIRQDCDEAAVADAREPRALEALRLHDYDHVVLSLGEPIDGSLLAVLHLRDLGIRNIVARAVTEDHRRLLQQLGVAEVVFPERDMAERTARTLSRRGFLDTLKLGDDVSLIEISPSKDMIGQTLSDLDLRRRYGVTVVAVRDALNDKMIVSPGADLRVCGSEALLVLGRDEDIDRFCKREMKG
jgi:trk system potassium uptake protein TrkA